MRSLVFLTFCVFLSMVSLAQAELRTRIIDTGSGHASVTRFPDGSVMVYDTGHWNHDRYVFNEIQSFVGSGDIDLLILSHSDSDHIAATDELFSEFRIQRVIRTGFERDTRTWEDHRNAIIQAAGIGLTHDINLAETNLPHGTAFKFGDAVVTFLAGFHKPPSAWGLTGSEYRNGNSIVVRAEFANRSILFTGDAVGREEGTSPTAPAIATERFLIDNSSTRPIASDVLIVPHHGSDDASSTEFIQAVAAQWVVFPAGHAHNHPKTTTAERYLDLGYDVSCLLRTDLGDNEGGSEWDHGGTGNRDGVGDDSVEIIVANNGDITVGYVGETPVSCNEVSGTGSPPSAPTIVKKSRSGICHTSASRWYTRTKHFTSFDDLASCLASGGRRP